MRRVKGDWKLLLVSFWGVLVAVCLISGIPIYLNTLSRVGLNQDIDGASVETTNVYSSARDIHLNREEIARVRRSSSVALSGNLTEFYRGHELQLKTNAHLLNPVQVVPEPKISLGFSTKQLDRQDSVDTFDAYLTNFPGPTRWNPDVKQFEENVRVVEGRLGGNNLGQSPEGYPDTIGTVEAVVGLPVARAHDLQVGDILTLSTSTTSRYWMKLSVRIVGLVEAIDPDSEFWYGRQEIFFNQDFSDGDTDPLVRTDSVLPPLPLVISQSAAIILPRNLVGLSRYRRFRSGGRDRCPDSSSPTTCAPKPKMMIGMTQDEARRQLDMAGSFAYLVYHEGVRDRVTVTDGRMPNATITMEPDDSFTGGRIVEAVVGVTVAVNYGLGIGELITLTPSSLSDVRVSARIVGFVEATNPEEEYWDGIVTIRGAYDWVEGTREEDIEQEYSQIFLNPLSLDKVPDLGAKIDGDKPPMALIISPNASAKIDSLIVTSPRYKSSESLFASLTNLADNIVVLGGRMPGPIIESGLNGPTIEAMITDPLGTTQFDVEIGDKVVVTPYVDDPLRITVEIVGVAQRDDPLSEYWRWGPAGLFAIPAPPPLQGPAPPSGPPPLPLILHEAALVDGIGDTFEGTLINAEWLTYVDRERLKESSIFNIRTRLANLDTDLSNIVPGQQTYTGIELILNNFEKSMFLARIPLLLLVTTMVAVVLYFLSMIVSYVVRSRERDLAALKTRGAGIYYIMRLYGTEGLVAVVIAVLSAPFIAMGGTALAGTLPYFRDLTGGELLPVEWQIIPFLVAIGAGLSCMILLLVPILLYARSGQLAHRFRSSRPNVVPWFHRYHIDLGLLFIGGIIFWELRSREEIVVGGLFQDAQINEALLLAPVLFLTVVALAFIRFFPMFLKFLSGESQVLIHLMSGLAVATLSGTIMYFWLSGDEQLAMSSIGLLAAFAITYWFTHRVGGLRRAAGFVVQGVIAGIFVTQDIQVSGVLQLACVVTIVVVVPLQILFMLLEYISRVSPPWVSIGLWRMTRNPQQYTWLVLLLVMLLGLATFATTVGKTLDRKDEERIMYDVATDVRITGSRGIDGWALREKYLEVPGVDLVVSAYRGGAESLPNVSASLKILGLEPEIFSAESWYRKDFSKNSLIDVMNTLDVDGTSSIINVPNESSAIGMWAKLSAESTALDVQMVLLDSSGSAIVVKFGRLVDRDWVLMRADLPPTLATPAQLVSLQVRPTSGNVSNPGGIHVDDIHVVSGLGGEVSFIEDFEGRSKWTPMPVSLNMEESVFDLVGDAHGGDMSGLYSYGAGANLGIPGIYILPGGGPLPVVISNSIMTGTEVDLGTLFVAAVNNRLVFMTVSDIVEHFPTMDPGKGGFLITDIELLFEHLRITNPSRRFTPNEFFLILGPEAGPETSEAIRWLSPITAEILSADAIKSSMRESMHLDILVTAGWRAMSLLSIAIVIFAGSMGYAAYMLFFAEKGRGEMYLLLSMGLRRRQVIGLLAMEHLIVVLVGIGVGIWAGIQMSGLTVPSVSLSSGSGSSLPPMLVTTDWETVGMVCGMLLLVFLGMVFLLNRYSLRSGLQVEGRSDEV